MKKRGKPGPRPKQPVKPRTERKVREAVGSYVAKAGREERPVRKNHYLYQSKIDMAKKVLGVSTETEAIDTALDLLIYGEALAVGTEEMFGEEYIDVLGIADEVPES
jgi:hypothetical protein